MHSLLYSLRLSAWSLLPVGSVVSLLVVVGLRPSLNLSPLSSALLPLLLGVCVVFLTLPLFTQHGRRRIRCGASPYEVWDVLPLRLRSRLSFLQRREEEGGCVEYDTGMLDGHTLSQTTKRAIVVGGGWSFFLRRELVPSHRRFVSSDLLVGRLSNGRWGAGTTIRDLQAHLKREGLTLAGHPSVDTATLGGWMFTHSHGSGGTLWKPAFGSMLVLDQDTGHIFEPDKSPFSDRVREEDQRRFVLLEVEVTPVRNVTCVRRAYDLDSLPSARAFLEEETYLRLLFVDALSSLAFVWGKDGGGVHRPFLSWWESVLSFLFQPWLATLLPSLSSRFPRRYWTKRMTLSDANLFSIEPPIVGSVVSLTYVNFEVFVHTHVTHTLLFRVVKAHRDLFSSHPSFTDLLSLGGDRVEVRCGRNILFLDYSLRSFSRKGGDKRRSVFLLLRSLFGSEARVGLHKGKMQVPMDPFPSLLSPQGSMAAEASVVHPR